MLRSVSTVKAQSAQTRHLLTKSWIVYKIPIRTRKEFRKCTMIPGDGVGCELMKCVEDVLTAMEAPVCFEKFRFSGDQKDCNDDLKTIVSSIEKNGACIKGTFGYDNKTGIYTAAQDFIRQSNMFVNVCPVKTMPGVKCRHRNVDMVIIRETLEGEYTFIEHQAVKGVVEYLKITTRKRTTRLAQFAFDYAMKNRRKKVTVVHKANIMKLTDGMFLDTCRAMSKNYPILKFESLIIDNTTTQLVVNPQHFDVIVTTNLYGNILDNVGAGLVGGAGLVPSAYYSECSAVFEPGARHTYKQGMDKNIVNPSAALFCAADMLCHLKFESYGYMLRKAVLDVLLKGQVNTRDLGGYSSTEAFTSAVICSLGKT